MTGDRRRLTSSRAGADAGVVSEQGASVGSAAFPNWLARAWPWVVGLSAAAGIIVGRALPETGVVTAVAIAWFLGIAMVYATLAVWWRRVVARVRRARPASLVIPGWAAATTLSRVRDVPGTGPKLPRLRVAFVATERSLELWRLDTITEVITLPWAQVAGVEGRSLVRGPFTSGILAVRLPDGTELGLQPLEPWAGGPPREPDDATEPTYADHLAVRLRATQERSATT